MAVALVLATRRSYRSVIIQAGALGPILEDQLRPEGYTLDQYFEHVAREGFAQRMARIQQLADDFARTGHHPFHLPVGIDLDESDPEAGRCVRCDRFDGFPCLTDGKADAHVLCVRPALRHDNVTLLTHANVERLEADGATVSEALGSTIDRNGKVLGRRGDRTAAGQGQIVLARSALARER